MRIGKQFILFVLLIPSSAWSQLYVSTTGSDRNQGNKLAPYATIAMAVRKAREMRRLNDPSIKQGIEIIVENGTYRLSEPLFIRPEDSGTDESTTIIKQHLMLTRFLVVVSKFLDGRKYRQMSMVFHHHQKERFGWQMYQWKAILFHSGNYG